MQLRPTSGPADVLDVEELELPSEGLTAVLPGSAKAPEGPRALAGEAWAGAAQAPAGKELRRARTLRRWFFTRSNDGRRSCFGAVLSWGHHHSAPPGGPEPGTVHWQARAAVARSCASMMASAGHALRWMSGREHSSSQVTPVTPVLIVESAGGGGTSSSSGPAHDLARRHSRERDKDAGASTPDSEGYSKAKCAEGKDLSTRSTMQSIASSRGFVRSTSSASSGSRRQGAGIPASTSHSVLPVIGEPRGLPHAVRLVIQQQAALLDSTGNFSACPSLDSQLSLDSLLEGVPASQSGCNMQDLVDF